MIPSSQGGEDTRPSIAWHRTESKNNTTDVTVCLWSLTYALCTGTIVHSSVYQLFKGHPHINWAEPTHWGDISPHTKWKEMAMRDSLQICSLLDGKAWFACSTIHFRKRVTIIQNIDIPSHTTWGKVAVSELSPRGQWEILFKYALLLDGMDWFACSTIHFRKDAEMDIIQNGEILSHTMWGKVLSP